MDNLYVYTKQEQSQFEQLLSAIRSGGSGGGGYSDITKLINGIQVNRLEVIATLSNGLNNYNDTDIICFVAKTSNSAYYRPLLTLPLKLFKILVKHSATFYYSSSGNVTFHWLDVVYIDDTHISFETNNTGGAIVDCYIMH